MEFLTSLFRSPIGRAVLVALVLLAAGSLGKVWYDQNNIPPGKREGERAETILKGAIAQLKERVDADPKAPFPERAGWTPAVLTCGAPVHVTAAEANHPTWKALGMTFKEPTFHQYLFYTRDQEFWILARTDFDCDGLYEVYRFRGGRGMTGLGSASLGVDNPGE
ncbi:MAG: hypothetical protein AAFX99_13770 [Myxococcota bacterium]